MVEALSALERQTKDESWKQVIRRSPREGGGRRIHVGPRWRHFLWTSIRSAAALSRPANPAEKPGCHARFGFASLTKRQMSPAMRSFGSAGSIRRCCRRPQSPCWAWLLTFVLPRFTALFKTLGHGPLPPTTKMLMHLSDFTISFWWTLPVIVGGASSAHRAWLRTNAGKRTTDKLVLRLPRFGPIVRKLSHRANHPFARRPASGKSSTGGRALELTKDSITNHLYVNLVNESDRRGHARRIARRRVF